MATMGNFMFGWNNSSLALDDPRRSGDAETPVRGHQ